MRERRGSGPWQPAEPVQARFRPCINAQLEPKGPKSPSPKRADAHLLRRTTCFSPGRRPACPAGRGPCSQGTPAAGRPAPPRGEGASRAAERGRGGVGCRRGVMAWLGGLCASGGCGARLAQALAAARPFQGGPASQPAAFHRDAQHAPIAENTTASRRLAFPDSSLLPTMPIPRPLLQTVRAARRATAQRRASRDCNELGGRVCKRDSRESTEPSSGVCTQSRRVKIWCDLMSTKPLAAENGLQVVCWNTVQCVAV